MTTTQPQQREERMLSEDTVGSLQRRIKRLESQQQKISKQLQADRNAVALLIEIERKNSRRQRVIRLARSYTDAGRAALAGEAS